MRSGEFAHADWVLSCSALAILCGTTEGVRVGSSVEVEGEYGVIQKGVVSDYTPGASTATIVLYSNPEPTIFPLKAIRISRENDIDFYQFPHLQSIVSILSLFLKPLPIPAAYSTLYFSMKARAMKILESIITTPECGKLIIDSGLLPTLVENALQVMPLDEEPKVARLEWQAALLREKLFESTYKYVKRRGSEYNEEEDEDYQGEEEENENGEGSEPSSDATSDKEDKEDNSKTALMPQSPKSSDEEEPKEPEDESTVFTGKVRWRDILAIHPHRFF